MKAALYIRVSTQEQVENYSIETQRERLEGFCKSKGWMIYETYIDGGYSGASTDRPALQKMLSELGQIDVVVVYKLDRLSRSQRDTLSLIEEHFLTNNVEFVSITETLDTSTPFGKAMIGILSVFAQLERETIAERMRMGHIKRAEEGYRTSGGNYDPSGYTRKNGELIIKEAEAKHIQKAYNLYEEYHSITKVQARLKELGFPVWRFRRYNDILRAKLYCGYVSFAGQYYKGRHEPIISEEQFERVQLLLERHKGPNAHKAKQSLLSGLLVCEKCGENFVTYSSKDKYKTYRYYICRARRFPSEYDEKCTNKNWNSEKLETIIREEISNFVSNKRLTKKQRSNNIDYDKLIKKIDEKIERFIDLYGEGEYDKKLLDKKIASADLEKRNLLAKKAQEEKTPSITNEQLNQFVIDLTTEDFSTKQAIIQKLIKQITIDDNDIDITWNF